jgi:hypothetical protein
MSKLYLDVKAKELGKSLENISEFVKADLENALEGLVYTIYNQGVVYAQQRLNKTRLQYLNSYHYQKMGDNIYLIYLDDETNYLEDGYNSFDMKPGLLNGPKSRLSKDGKSRYNTVPFHHMPYSKAPASMAQQQIRQNLLDTIKRHKLDEVFKSAAGKPLEGVVARLKGKDMAANLQGLVKIQKVYDKKVEGHYMTFRRVSSKSDPSKWIHPGWKGAKIFDSLEEFSNEKIEEILNTIL